MRAIYYCLATICKTTIKNYIIDFDSNINFNRLLDIALVYIVIKELLLILLNEESLIYKQAIFNFLQKQ